MSKRCKFTVGLILFLQLLGIMAIAQNQSLHSYKVMIGYSKNNYFDKANTAIRMTGSGPTIGLQYTKTKKSINVFDLQIAYFSNFRLNIQPKSPSIGNGFYSNISYLHLYKKKLLNNSNLNLYLGYKVEIPTLYRKIESLENNPHSFNISLPSLSISSKWVYALNHLFRQRLTTATTLIYNLSIPIVSYTGNTSYTGLFQGKSGIDILKNQSELTSFNKRIFITSDMGIHLVANRLDYQLGYRWDFEYSKVNAILSIWGNHLIYMSFILNKGKEK